MFVPIAGPEFQEKHSWGQRGGAGPGRAGSGPGRGGAGRGGAGRAGAEQGPAKKGEAGRAYYGPGGNEPASCSALARPRGSSGGSSRAGRTLGTMTQTPAFDKPKVSAGRGSGSGFWLLVWLEGLGASTERDQRALRVLSSLSAGPRPPLG